MVNRDLLKIKNPRLIHGTLFLSHTATVPSQGILTKLIIPRTTNHAPV